MKHVMATVVVVALGVSAASAAEPLCFARNYTSAHLAQHPDQLVTSMTLALDPYHDRVNRTTLFVFKIAMTKRGDNKLYVQEGDVSKNDDGKYQGSVECDGGGFILQKISSGMLLSLGLGTGSADYIRVAVLPDPCSESEQVNKTYIERGKDDHTFRLDTQSVQVCSRLFDKIDWDAVGRQNQ